MLNKLLSTKIVLVLMLSFLVSFAVSAEPVIYDEDYIYSNDISIEYDTSSLPDAEPIYNNDDSLTALSVVKNGVTVSAGKGVKIDIKVIDDKAYAYPDGAYNYRRFKGIEAKKSIIRE